MNVKLFENKLDFACNLYVFNKNDLVIVVDPGFYNDEVKTYLETLGHVDAILLTHGHFDHIKGLDDLAHDFGEAKTYIFKDEYDFLTHPELNMNPNLIIKSKVNVINEGVLQIKRYDIEVIHTPGHTKGSVIYYFKEDNILFTGDTIFNDSIGRMDLPTGSYNDMISSIHKFIDLNYKDNTIIYPGHESITNYITEKNNLIDMKY